MTEVEGGPGNDDVGSGSEGSQPGRAPSFEPDRGELQAVEDPAAAASEPGPVAEGGGGFAGFDAQAIGEALRQQGVAEEQINEIVSVQMRHFRSAPLPTPDEFAGFEAVLPGAANRIVTMAEETLAAEVRRSDGAVADAHTATDAEAVAFKVTAFAVSLLPWGLAVLTAFFLLVGQDTGATIGAIATAVAASPQLINAVRGRSAK